MSLINKMPVNKATGLDGIPAILIKSSSALITDSLVEIFNSSLTAGVFLDLLKLAKVFPVFKQGDKTQCDNHRPISILPIISKLFEKLIFEQLYEYLTTNKLLSEHQSGFGPFHST